MYLKKMFNLRNTLVFRLTFSYFVIFTISSLVAFFVFYFLITSVVQQRTDQGLLDEIEELSSLFSLKGIDDVKTAIILEAESEGTEKIFFRVIGPTGEPIAVSDMASWRNFSVSSAALKRLADGANHIFKTVAIPEHRHKVRVLYGMIGPGIFLQSGVSLEDDAIFIEKFRKIFTVTFVGMIIFAVLVGYFMARWSLLGVEDVTRTALDIAKGDFDRRVPERNRGDEIERLATTFNRMLDHIQTLMREMREMTDHIAHELKTPITRIRGIAEITLSTGKSIQEYENMAASTIEESDSLLEMINTMLAISETEAGAVKIATEAVDITSVIRNACELFQPIAENEGLDMICKIPERCCICGNIRMLQRMVANLLDNALKYTPSPGTVTVSVNKNEKDVIISVEDTGIGISEEDMPRIFNRFYRCDRSRAQAGVGLGLSFVMAIARAHGGDVSVTSSFGKGSIFTVILPTPPVFC